MPNPQMLTTLYAYNAWANERVFAAADKVAADGLSASALEGQRSLRELLFHIVRTEWLWRNLVLFKARPENAPRPEDMPGLPALRAFAADEARQMQALLAQLGDTDLGATVQVVDGSGQASPLVIWHMLMQPIVHGVQHRSEASLILTDLGQSPSDLDFIFFV